MSDAEAPGPGRKRAASADLAAAVASAMEGEDVSLASPGAADALAALEAVGGGGHAADQEHEEEEESTAEDALALGDASMFDNHTVELARWLEECRAAGSGGETTHDDVFFFFETTHPEVLDHLPQLFHWISVFMDRLGPDPLFLEAQETYRPIPSWVPDAVLRLEATGDLATVATESGLKSPVTLLYWKNEHAKRELQREHDSHRALGDLAVAQVEEEPAEVAAAAVGDAFGDIARHRTAFMREDELAEWLRSHKHDQLTRQDVINHVLEAYPAFAATKSPAALKVWTSRFLKRHLASNAAGGGVKSVSTSKSSSDKAPRGLNISEAASEEDGEAPALSSSASVQAKAENNPQNAVLTLEQPGDSTSEATTVASAAEPASETAGKMREARPATSRKRRGACTGGYVLHSNEFKLNALRKLDEGKSVSEVAQELGL
jgi:transposase-like protein